MAALGKKPYVHDDRNLRFSKYSTSLPAPQPTANWDHYVSAWPMFLNDQLGDCTCAEVAHQFELWCATSGAGFSIGDADVEALYEAVGGYVPGDPATDQGCVIQQVLDYLQKTGMGPGGSYRIDAYTAVAPLNHTEVAQAIDLFGGVDIGLQLPTAAQSMGQHWTAPPGWPAPTPIGQPQPVPTPAPHRHPWWDLWADIESWINPPQPAPGPQPAPTPPLTGDWTPGSWGGHSVYALGYDAAGVTVVTWGELTAVDWGFWDAYVDECWALLSHSFVNPAGLAASGFDLAALQADLAAL